MNATGAGAASVPGGAALGENTYAAAAAMASRLEQITAQLHHEVARLGTVRPGGEAEAQHQLKLLQDELRGMGRLIAETRSEVAGLIPGEQAHSRLTCASGELDSVVSATERAAVEIMGAAERSQDAIQHIRAEPGLSPEVLRHVDVIDNAAMDIVMACSFQDLTGQRIRKVVQALNYIEQRIISLAALWEGSVDLTGAEAPSVDDRPDSHLLNGPTENGLEQNAIDALLNGTGSAPTGEASQDAIDALFP
ncbi:MAG TPA: protein phosphatase CheZ [Acetobacteraceae bacterium]|nr:protein phosphatase CheZ [Acetobacteraceae bacterium]